MTVKVCRPETNTTKLGGALLEAGAINEKDLNSALTEQKRTGHKLSKVLKDLGLTTEMEMVRTIADNMGLEYVELQKSTIAMQRPLRQCRLNSQRNTL
ncbi:MAG: hypothetical protein HQK99_01550 [Nitrospirae bacterium]|nr:hypothetical protein [Nitrospirota bacterium]